MNKRILWRTLALAMVAGLAAGEVRFMIVEPGHFHAALILQEMYPQASPRVSVFTSLTPDLLEFLNRVTLFNTRPVNPTAWQLDIHTGEAFFDRMLAERPGNVAVFAGRNREKIGRIARSLDAGFHVLADKPWVIASEDVPRLAAALDTAQRNRLVAYDIMTERYEVTSILQKEMVNTPEVFGELERGSASSPAVRARSIHYLMKSVAGVPLRRPSWFLNIEEAGEGIADVGTHVVDLVQWTAFPRQSIDYRNEVAVLDARRRPTVVSQAQFAQVTGEREFPPHLARWVKDGRLEYFANHTVAYTVRGVHIALDTEWGWEAAPGSGDVYEAAFRGARSRVEIRQGKEQNFRPELYVVPNPEAREQVFASLRRKIAGLERQWPGLEVEMRDNEAHILIPEKHRLGHEAHFAQVTRAFLGYLEDPGVASSLGEKSNMLVKYFITTKAVELSRTRK